MDRMKDYESYVKKVDRHLADLRAKYLGQDTHFDAVLPPEANRWNDEEKADHLTRLLLFSLAKTEPAIAILPELEESYSWLKTLILYLYHACAEVSYTFASITKVAKTDEGIREMIVEQEPAFALLKTEPPFLLQYLDVAILHLLNCRGMNAGEEEFLHHVPKI